MLKLQEKANIIKAGVRKKLSILIIVLLLLTTVSGVIGTGTSEIKGIDTEESMTMNVIKEKDNFENNEETIENLASVPLFFTENQGQWPEEALFKTDANAIIPTIKIIISNIAWYFFDFI